MSAINPSTSVPMWASEALEYPLDALSSLHAKTVVISGASSGIGRGFAIAAARLGAAVILMARREDRLREVASVIEPLGARVESIAVDLSDRKSLREVAERARTIFGGPDVLVNAAGVNHRRAAADVADEDWDQTWEINVSASFFLAQSLAPAMIAKGWGRVINIASLQSVRAFPNSISYGASKGAIVQLTRAMAEYWSSHGVLCNALAPGFIPTELTEQIARDPSAVQALSAKTMIGRVGRVTDLFGPLSFLASEASAYVTGQTIFVDGGFTAK
jgi:NAD(P)-dependent dehydrogenase (short-subunit alcohol dehydrogenase family)